MGITLSDLSKNIKDEHADYLDVMMRLIAKHKSKAQECAKDITDIDQTTSMLLYSKCNRCATEEEDWNVSPYSLIIAEEDTQRSLARQQLLQHTAIAQLFEDDLKDFLVAHYHIHKNIVDEWHIDLDNMLIFRKLKAEQEKEQEGKA